MTTIIQTTKGPIEESQLRKVAGVFENSHEFTTWAEYYIGDELVSRSAHVTLKPLPVMEAIAGVFNG